MRIAAMDLGTNTFRILIGELSNGRLKEIYRETNITRLGEGLNQTNVINGNAVTRSVTILKKYRKLIKQYDAQKVLAAGTSAFRNAVNAKTLVKYFNDETGINIDIISGDKEAELTVAGVIKSMELPLTRFYHLDIGGGSTEISFINNGKIELSKSLELGVVSLAEDHSLKNAPLTEISKYVRKKISDSINTGIEANNNLPLVATSGTPIVIACILSSLSEFKPALVNEMKISTEQVNEIKSILVKDNNSGKLDKYGKLLKGREDLIVPGTVILSETMKYLGNDCMIISDSGLLEGLSYI